MTAPAVASRTFSSLSYAERKARWKTGLFALLCLCILRLWLMPLPSSLWVDELGTVFVVHHGAADPSPVLQDAEHLGVRRLERGGHVCVGWNRSVFGRPERLDGGDREGFPEIPAEAGQIGFCGDVERNTALVRRGCHRKSPD